ncbi:MULTISPECIES: VacJ family lipoprotein [unclassified Campylobacter]|uniref:MlaA family lipoprotein n=1 Tax=unclassified Campylobacter TaxID=2593542 RepID=UPI0012382AB6|nr:MULTISPECIES: MlaA family lipoprotein [unclassified Campylobacter]KAA6224956.1 VacJ family lipoprotein [Campylobacter sp. LR286c]KAA6228471.1 VacJ family lipoprotein [Campylobacter sp. LR185c]KAA6228957.1 VacJ family lipoprotein [Campylobacter sp. LR196d]KAA8603771.1 hypothetical protein CGP82_06080 [Campylobacter sp. LR185c]
MIENNTIISENEFDEFEEEFEQYEINDPLAGYNKMMTSFNVALYTYAFRPVLKGYEYVAPKPIRTGVRNFFSNLLGPLRIISQTLQFKFDKASDEIKRFLANTILGLGGIFDSATDMKIPKHPGDIGTAFASWGIKSGFHIVLPILGPSNLRDLIALPFDWYLSPTAYLDDVWLRWGISVYGYGNELSFRTDEIDEIYYNTPNLYPFLRDAYEQSRIELSK